MCVIFCPFCSYVLTTRFQYRDQVLCLWQALLWDISFSNNCCSKLMQNLIWILSLFHCLPSDYFISIKGSFATYTINNIFAQKSHVDRLHYIAASLSVKTMSSISCQRLKRSVFYDILSSSCVWIHNKSTGRVE